ncbi:MAG: response regulator [Spongiibacteraceae bacterium]
MRQPHRAQAIGMRWLPLWLCLVCASSFGAPLIKITHEFTRADLSQYADILVDPSLQLTIDQVATSPIANNFAPATSALFQKADRRNVYWLRLGVDNPLHETRMLAINRRVSNNVAIEAFDASLQPLPLQRTPLLNLLIPPQSKQLFYLRVGPGALELSQLELLSLEQYLADYHALSWLTGLFQGVLLFFAIAATGGRLLRNDNAYLWLAGHCCVFFVFQTLYRADYNPILFNYIPEWPLRSPLLLTCFLVSNICGIQIAFHLAITRTARGKHFLNLLLWICALATPIVFILKTPINTAMTLCITLLVALTTLAIALYNFLLSHRRELLFYALARTLMLLIALGGGFAWRSNSSLRLITDNMIPIAMTAEAICLLGILVWRSFEQQRERIHSEREIAVLEAEARSRTEVVAEVGHRVRTPISGVIGMLDMLEDTSLSTTQLDYLNTVRRASNELLNTVNEISDISRLQSQSALLQQSVLDPHALLSECIDGFRSTAKAHNLEIISDISPKLPARVCGDSTRLRQIVLQLMHHIINQYRDGEIVVHMRQLQRDWLRIEIQSRALRIKDTNDSDRRFNPSQPAQVRFAIARQLVNLLGGVIETKHTLDDNVHTAVDLELPFVERDEPDNAVDVTLQNKRLLVIDDNSTFCEVIARQVQHWGMMTFVAHSIHEGLAHLRNQLTLSQPIDIVLLDIDIPDLESSDWLQRLHNEIHPLPMTIFLSSDANENALARAIDSRRVLLKPINHANLKITLIEELKRREQRRLPTSHKRSDPIRCLFAEDNSLNAEVLSSMLDRLGVIYTATSNGQEAVDACQRGNFDIILMDWDMPVMDGWEASRRIREIFAVRNQASIPIITLTANTVEELGERARQSVADAHLVKPIQLNNLRELLEHWTGKVIKPIDHSPT